MISLKAIIPARWKASATETAATEEKYYKNGERKNGSRSIPIGGGGNGKVIGKLSESDLAKKG